MLPLVYFFVPVKEQRRYAFKLKEELGKRGFGLPQVWVKPEYTGENQLRYFHDSDAENAKELEKALKDLGLNVTTIPTLRYADKVQPRLYEVWLDPNALLPNPAGGQ